MKVEHTPERIVECVNAFEGIEDPKEFMYFVKKLKLDDFERVSNENKRLKKWQADAMKILKKIMDFEHPEMKLGESKIDFILKLAPQRDELQEERDRYKAALMDIDQLRPINQERTIVCFGIAKKTARLALSPELF